MKRLIYLLFALPVVPCIAQDSEVIDTKPHKIIMQFTTGDSLDQVAVVTQVGNILAALPKSKIEVVCHGGGLDLLTSKKSKAQQQLTFLTGQGVVFAACQNSMRRRNVKKEDLVAVAKIVPSAMVELVLKQEAGWSYVKGAH